MDATPLNEMLEDWDRLRIAGEINDEADVLDYIDVDAELETSETPGSFDFDTQASEDERMEDF